MTSSPAAPNSTQARLDGFGFRNINDLVAWWMASPPLHHGSDLLHAMVDKGLSAESSEVVKQACAALLKQATPRDPMMDALGKEWGDFLRDAFCALASTPKAPPVAAVEMDFSNMGAANHAIGREQVDRAVRVITAIYTQEIARAGGQYTAVRLGGDELRYYVTGLSQEELKVLLHAAQKRVLKFVTALGLDGLEHEKHEGNAIRAGFGVGVGFVDLSNPEQGSEIVLRRGLDQQISADKFAIGETKAARLDLRGGDLQKPRTLHAQILPQVVERILAGAEKELGIQGASRTIPYRAPMFDGIEDKMRAAKGKAFGDVYAARTAMMEAWLSEKTPAVSDNSERLVRYLVDLCNPIDPTTGLKTAASSGKSFAILREKVPMSLAELEVTNLTGMNKALGPERTNQLLRRYMTEFQKDLDAALGDFSHQLFSVSGTRMRLLVGKIDAQELQKKCQAISKLFVEWLQTQSEGSQLAVIENPRRKQYSLMGEAGHEQGVELRYMVMPAIDTPLDYRTVTRSSGDHAEEKTVRAPDHKLHAWSHFQLLEELKDVYSGWPQALGQHLQAARQQASPVLLPEEQNLRWWVGGAQLNATGVHLIEPHAMQGIPHAFLQAAIEGKRIPREALPKIVGVSTQETPSTKVATANLNLLPSYHLLVPRGRRQ